MHLWAGLHASPEAQSPSVVHSPPATVAELEEVPLLGPDCALVLAVSDVDPLVPDWLAVPSLVDAAVPELVADPVVDCALDSSLDMDMELVVALPVDRDMLDAIVPSRPASSATPC